MNRKRLVMLLCMTLLSGLTGVSSSSAGTTLTGSGASFPYQIYSLWFILFGRDNPDIEVGYTPKGSGGGIKDLQNHLVDFAASDAAMSEDEIAKVPEGVLLLPMTAGEVVLAYNLPGVSNLNLPRAVYAGIFLGTIRNWNHAAIAAANPGIELPDLEITVVTRRDSSGTTFVFTKHLSAISEEFGSTVGFGKKVTWPEGLKMIRSSINAGISASISTTPGAIGYLDFGFASLAGLQMASLENRAGKFRAPGEGGGQTALANTPLPENLIAWLPDPDGEKSYPITTYTWLLFYKRYADPEKAAALRSMVFHFLDVGQRLSDRFGYIALPADVVATVRKAALDIQ